MKGKSPHSRTHAMSGLPPMEACLACHQRSGRHALSYQGLMDGNNGLVPTQGGGPGPMRASDDRNFTHIAADVHFLAGMECIDCHTSREIMGEGYAAPDMRGQLEIRCEDCHGDGERSPSFVTVSRESDLPLRESRQYGQRVRPGDRVALTGRAAPTPTSSSARARSSWPRSARASCCAARWSPARPSTPSRGTSGWSARPATRAASCSATAATRSTTRAAPAGTSSRRRRPRASGARPRTTGGSTRSRSRSTTAARSRRSRPAARRSSA